MSSDAVVTLDESGLTVRDYYLPRRPRHVRYDEIVHAEVIDLGFWTGRHQLVGIGPFRPRLFFPWDRRRAGKSQAVVIDLGKWLRIAVTPEDPDRLLATLRERISGV